MNEGQAIHLVVHIVKVVGTAIIVVGSFAALIAFVLRFLRRTTSREQLFAKFRSDLGRSILLGLESSSLQTSSTPSQSNPRSKV